MMVFIQVEYAADDDDEEADEYGDDEDYDDDQEEEEEEDEEEDDDEEDDDGEPDDEEQWDRGWSGDARSGRQMSNSSSRGVNTSVSSDSTAASDKVCLRIFPRLSASDYYFTAMLCCIRGPQLFRLRSVFISCSKESRFSRPTQV
jgi:hypothetical protein